MNRKPNRVVAMPASALVWIGGQGVAVELDALLREAAEKELPRLAQALAKIGEGEDRAGLQKLLDGGGCGAMRILSAIDAPLADEHVIGTDPPLRPELPGVWRRRIKAFRGAWAD
jgi:hypothetical protein